MKIHVVLPNKIMRAIFFKEIDRTAFGEGYRPSSKIVILSKSKEWAAKVWSWVLESLVAYFINTPPGIVECSQNNQRALSLVIDHPNCLVLLEGEDNEDAIKDFIQKQKAFGFI